MRVFVASLATETNTFSPLYVDRSAFEVGLLLPARQTSRYADALFRSGRRGAPPGGGGRIDADRRNGDLG